MFWAVSITTSDVSSRDAFHCFSVKFETWHKNVDLRSRVLYFLFFFTGVATFEDEYGFSVMLVPRKQTGLCVFASFFSKINNQLPGSADVCAIELAKLSAFAFPACQIRVAVFKPKRDGGMTQGQMTWMGCSHLYSFIS